MREIRDEDDITISVAGIKIPEVPKVEAPVFEVEVIVPAVEEPKVVEAPKVEVPKVEAPKVEEPKPTVNNLDAREGDFKAKKLILDDLIAIAGPDNDYVDFVRKNYKKGLDQCLNAWFEAHN